MDQCSPHWEGTHQAKFQKTSQKTPRKQARTNQHVHCCSCWVRASTILLCINALHMTGHHNKRNECVHSPLKTVLRKIRNRYQSYCATYTMITCHGGVRHTGKDRDLDSHVEDTRNIDDNECTNSSETMIAFGGSEMDGCLGNHLPNKQVDLNVLMREIQSLWQ